MIHHYSNLLDLVLEGLGPSSYGAADSTVNINMDTRGIRLYDRSVTVLDYLDVLRLALRVNPKWHAPDQVTCQAWLPDRV